MREGKKENSDPIFYPEIKATKKALCCCLCRRGHGSLISTLVRRFGDGVGFRPRNSQCQQQRGAAERVNGASIWRERASGSYERTNENFIEYRGKRASDSFPFCEIGARTLTFFPPSHTHTSPPSTRIFYLLSCLSPCLAPRSLSLPPFPTSPTLGLEKWLPPPPSHTTPTEELD